MICFDSNSYLGLHLDPRVNEAVKKAVVDQVSHASIHDGVRYAQCRSMRYPYRDIEALDALLTEHREGANGVLIVAEGMFSMHGDLADLPGLRRVADAHDAKLMVDDAHSLALLGATGLGIEEHFDMEGACDILMGTFSKAPGAAGGYVSGDAAFIDDLRFMSRGALFTATLPAPTCAGVLESIRIMHEEPELLERLWTNSYRFRQGVSAAGVEVPELESPIIAIQVGDEKWLTPLSFVLYKAGIKCGIARFSAVAKHHAILRFTMNARHTEADIDRPVEVLADLWQQLGIGAESE